MDKRALSSALFPFLRNHDSFSLRGALILLGLVVFVCAWLLPGHFPPWPAFQQQWAAALGVALLGLGSAWKPNKPWQWPLPALGLLCLALVPLMQRAAGQILFDSDAVLPTLFVVAFALSVAIAANLARSYPEQWADWLMTALLVAASVSAGLAVVQWLRLGLPYLPLDPLPPGARLNANLAQPNHLATLLALGVAATLHLFERQRVGVATAALLCTWLGLGLVMTQSRTGWLFVGSVALWWSFEGDTSDCASSGVLALSACFAAAVLCWSAINQGLALPSPATLIERTDTGIRVRLWQAMLEAIGRSPWSDGAGTRYHWLIWRWHSSTTRGSVSS
jgi:multisubunit Na+/H+ antiporter MnhB subunit